MKWRPDSATDENMKKTKQIALGGLLAALAVVILLLGSLIPIGTYVAPMLASFLLVPLLAALPKGLCLCWYAAAAIPSETTGLCPAALSGGARPWRTAPGGNCRRKWG